MAVIVRNKLEDKDWIQFTFLLEEPTGGFSEFGAVVPN